MSTSKKNSGPALVFPEETEFTVTEMFALRQSTRNPFFFFLNALTMALGNVNAAPVRLNALMIENVRLSPSALQGRIILHYTNQFTSQLYRILGSADAFGNPVGLFSNVSSGVQDIFYEPYQGFVLHGNKDLASGIARVSLPCTEFSTASRSGLMTNSFFSLPGCNELRQEDRLRSVGQYL